MFMYSFLADNRMICNITMARRMDIEINQPSFGIVDEPQSRLEDMIDEDELDALKRYLQDGDNEIAKDELSSALCFAIKQGKAKPVKDLLEAGADKDSTNALGFLPVNIAVTKGTLEIVQLLVEAGCNLNKRDRQGRSPLHMAATCSVQPQALNVAEYLIVKGADIGGKDLSGESALMRACYCSSLDMVKLLLRYTSDVNEKTPYNRTALHYATMSENGAKVAELLRAGANPNVVDLECESPLILATQSGKLEIVKMLREADCDLNIKGAMGYNSLHWAMITNEHEIAAYLIDNGIDVNMQSCLYRTPLHQAASTNAIAIVKKLLQNSADTEVMDSNQETPLLTACRYGHAEVAKELLIGNAHTEMGNFGVTALEVAVDHGYLNIAVMLMIADCDPNVLIRGTPGRKDIFENFRRKTKRDAAMHHIKKFMKLFVKTPRPLQQLSRVAIRRTLSIRSSGYQISENVNQLPIPEQLKDYVNRKDLTLHDPTTYNLQ